MAGPQLQTVTDMCERPTESIQPCPLCPEKLTLNRLRRHLGQHLQDISLFALPSLEIDGSDMGSNYVQGPIKNDTFQELSELESTLSFNSLPEKNEDDAGAEPHLANQETQLLGPTSEETSTHLLLQPLLEEGQHLPQRLAYVPDTGSSRTDLLGRINGRETIVKNRYLLQYKLVDLLDRLFPDQWSLQVRTIRVIQTLSLEDS
jgi:hypothetical protein